MVVDIKEQHKKYYQENKDKYKINMKRNYEENKERYKKQAAKWRKENPERFKLSNLKTMKEWKKKNPDYDKEWLIKRTIEIYNKLGNKCVKCGFNNIIALQVHHKNNSKKGKRDWVKNNYNLDNIELLCANCHFIKHYGERKYAC